MFSQTLTFQEAFDPPPPTQINKELNRTEFDGAFCKKMQTSN